MHEGTCEDEGHGEAGSVASSVLRAPRPPELAKQTLEPGCPAFPSSGRQRGLRDPGCSPHTTPGGLCFGYWESGRSCTGLGRASLTTAL